MILKSSEKTDVNMTELVATVDAETFERLLKPFISVRRTFLCRVSGRAKFREDCVKELMAKAFSLKML